MTRPIITRTESRMHWPESLCLFFLGTNPCVYFVNLRVLVLFELGRRAREAFSTDRRTNRKTSVRMYVRSRFMPTTETSVMTVAAQWWSKGTVQHSSSGHLSIDNRPKTALVAKGPSKKSPRHKSEAETYCRYQKCAPPSND